VGACKSDVGAQARRVASQLPSVLELKLESTLVLNEESLKSLKSLESLKESIKGRIVFNALNA